MWCCMAVEFVKIEGLEGVLRTLKQLPPEIVSARGGPVRRALRKASLVMKNEMQANVQKIIDDPNLSQDGRVIPLKSTGLAVKNIITTRRKNPPGIKGEWYRVGPRLRKKYPSAGGAKEVTVVQNLRQLETGTERRRPYPWARPAFDARKNEVLQVFPVELKKDIARIERRLAKKNGVA